jgi:hypothetical protein
MLPVLYPQSETRSRRGPEVSLPCPGCQLELTFPKWLALLPLEEKWERLLRPGDTGAAQERDHSGLLCSESTAKWARSPGLLFLVSLFL